MTDVGGPRVDDIDTVGRPEIDDVDTVVPVDVSGITSIVFSIVLLTSHVLELAISKLHSSVLKTAIGLPRTISEKQSATESLLKSETGLSIEQGSGFQIINIYK